MDIIQNKLYTVKEFCEMNRITKSTFFKIKKLGQAPKLIQLNRKVLISGKAILEWREAMENKQL